MLRSGVIGALEIRQNGFYVDKVRPTPRNAVPLLICEIWFR